MSDHQVLSSTQQYRIVYHPAKTRSDKLIVTFSPKNETLADAGFGTKFALSLGYDTVFVSSHHKVMHRALDIETLESFVLPIADRREIIAYGASAGAYAALYFGGKLNAKIIAFSPRHPVHPYLSGETQKSFDDLNHILDLKDAPLSKHKPIIVFDPFDKIDANFTNKWALPAYPDAHVYFAPNAGHGVVRRMKENGTLKPTITKMFEGIIPDAVTVWDETHHNHHYAKGFQAAQSGDDKRAADHFQTALTISEQLSTYYALTQCAQRLGDTDLETKTKLASHRFKKARHAAIRQSKLA
ncbi:hypothetical protein ERN12_04190 [Rhodobacteraceae bacterium]|nr:hypothetical protein ERN12_04190 [Paracoccaceae bacterium]